MARIKNGILGALSGKLGPVVGSTWNGIPYLRSLPIQTNKKKEPTQKQGEYWKKFGTLTNSLSRFTPLVNITFKGQDEKMTPFNSLVKNNSIEILNGSFPDYEPDYSKVKLSIGKLSNGANPSASMEGTNFVFTWENDSGSTSAMGNDQPVLIVYCPERTSLIYSINGSRNQSSAFLDVKDFKGSEVHTWICFLSEDRKLKSNSMYTGAFIVTVPKQVKK